MWVSRLRKWLTAPLAEKPPWIDSIDDIALNHAQVSGNMGAFSIPVFVLILTSYPQPENNISFALGLFLLSTFCFIITSVLYSISIKQEESHQFMIFSCSGYIYLYAAVAIFCGFYMLTQEIPILSLMIPLMMIGGFLGGFFAAWIPIRIAFETPLINGILILLFSAAVSCGISIYYISVSPAGVEEALTYWFAISLGLTLLVFVVSAMSFTYLEPLTRCREKQISQASAFTLSSLSLSTVLITLFIIFEKTP